MPLVNAVLSGEANRLPGELRRFRELALNPVAVVLAAINVFGGYLVTDRMLGMFRAGKREG